MANNSGKSNRGSQRGASGGNKRSDEGSGMKAQGNERTQQDEGRGSTGRDSRSSGGSGNGGRGRKGSNR